MNEAINNVYTSDTVTIVNPASPSNGDCRQGYDPLKEIINAYSDYYQDYKDHSPAKSRGSLIRRAGPAITAMGINDYTLDLGSGRQLLEREIKQKFRKLPGRFVTFDIARISQSQLLLHTNSRVDHVRGDGNHLPFADNTMMVVVSNMALDFMKEDSLDEIYRVTKPRGHIFINLCFSYLDIDLRITKAEERKDPMWKKQESDRWKTLVDSYGRLWARLHYINGEDNFWNNYLQHESVLITDPAKITPMFLQHGFSIERVEEAKIPDYTWWEVDMRKPI